MQWGAQPGSEQGNNKIVLEKFSVVLELLRHYRKMEVVGYQKSLWAGHYAFIHRSLMFCQFKVRWINGHFGRKSTIFDTLQ